MTLDTVAAAGSLTASNGHRRMGQALVAVVALMLGSAIERMQRYIGVFGRSLDRLYASVAMCWIAVALAGFGCTVLRCRRDKFVAVVVRVRGSRWCW